MQHRKKLVIANWKMNGNKVLVDTFLNELAELETNCEVVVCPPAIYLSHFQSSSQVSRVFKSGAQNINEHASGAYTGELSVSMLSDIGVEYVIVGHSERRAIFGESDQVVGLKAKAAIAESLHAVICVGETLEERESDNTFKVLDKQLAAIFNELAATDWPNVTIAYEPVWAIGTGKTATPQQAQEVHAYIRQAISQSLGEDKSQMLTILYGGSVNAGNSEELFAQADVDGGLVGGASLKIDEFKQICLNVSAD